MVAEPARRSQRPNHRLYVRPATTDDLDFMVATQMKSPNVGTPGLLGQSYLRRYYRTFIYNPACWTRVAYCDEHPAGFIVGVLRPAERSRTVPPRQRIVLLLLGWRALVIHPRLVRLLLADATRRVPSNATGIFPLMLARIQNPSRDGRSRSDAPPATLTYLAVRFIYEELGIGTRLVETFEAAALSYGVTTANVVVPPGDLPAEAFFRNRGWSAAPGSEPTGSDCARQLTRNLALTAPASGRSAPAPDVTAPFPNYRWRRARSRFSRGPTARLKTRGGTPAAQQDPTGPTVVGFDLT